MRLLGVLATRGEDAYARGDKVVVLTNRGLETGEVLCLATENAIKMNKPLVRSFDPCLLMMIRN